jgi:hypothetical protein
VSYAAEVNEEMVRLDVVLIAFFKELSQSKELSVVDLPDWYLAW